ncbi:ABC transporter ATP-binding protein [Paenibacillus pinistramenti]|uniref:ABC transporter ATP-binding protein n=1 Tax=Paenibacillus pinistramenti TaxID=1768003 RepID=UPI0011090081|nr:ABC transporter ATP-binding protein [Paenibacillus pinistramenti]
MIELQGVTKSFAGDPVLEGLNWQVHPGEFWGIIGPNGSGKSTLLQLIAGAEKPDNGEIRLWNRPAASYSRKALSRKLAVLQQDGLPPVSFPVREVVEMGRFPYLDWLGRDQTAGADLLVDRIMDRLDLTPLAARPLSELSGGQRQRAALGKVMAQEPELVLLDEPTTYLDIHYQIQFMELLSEWKKQSAITVLAAIHDINLAALYCDQLLVIKQGKVIAAGRTSEVLSTTLLREVFDVDSVLVHPPGSDTPQFLFRPEGEDG